MTTELTVSNNGSALQLNYQTASGWTTTGVDYCWGCGSWPCRCNQNHYHYIYPQYSYTVQGSRAAELKAWIDGYMTDRKMTEKALRRVQEKIEEFLR